MTTNKLALCLDGPLNGMYASMSDPPEEYTLDEWPTGEAVFIHTTSEEWFYEQVD